MCFSLETASSYVKDEKATFFGFKCTVIGYQWSVSANESLAQLEREIACLGGMCAASLMKRDLALPHGKFSVPHGKFNETSKRGGGGGGLSLSTVINT